jgi:Beta-galactosidase
MAKATKKSVPKQPKDDKKPSGFSFPRLWRGRSLLFRSFLILISIVVLLLSTSYGIAFWYQNKHRNDPLVLGATFVPNYARYFELDPEETLQAMIDELGIRRFRLVSYWKIHEPVEDQYDFSELDWQFDMIEQAGGEISLAIGLRQPRWPECHGPEWAMQKAVADWTDDLNEYMGVVIDRYKDRAVLREYQLENEYFLSVFGECPDFSRERLIKEFEYVKSKDPTRDVIISRSNNAIGFPIGEPQPDKFALTVYKRVWDKTITRRYFEYPFPPWFYGFLAGGGEILTGKDLFVHELQTEAWLPEGQSMKTADVDELYKSLSPERLRDRIKYGVDTGMRTVDLWGVEWWYHMKTKRDAPELWQAAQEEIARYQNSIR